MKITTTNIEGLLIIEPKVFGDSRGFFLESYSNEKYYNAGVKTEFIQDNLSRSSYGVIRGLHYQLEPYAQAKLVQVLEGTVLDVALDIRLDSPTFGQWFAIELSDRNKIQFYIPEGFAHGFSVLSETALFHYKCNNYYNPESERGIAYNDQQLNIDWRVDSKLELISEKDKNNPWFSQADFGPGQTK
jgi:dTDP-4-dehydrorhamnose 3,5-epimerase